MAEREKNAGKILLFSLLSAALLTGSTTVSAEAETAAVRTAVDGVVGAETAGTVRKSLQKKSSQPQLSAADQRKADKALDGQVRQPRSPVEFTAVQIIDKDTLVLADKSLGSAQSNESVVIVENGGRAEMKNVTLAKSGDNTSGEYSDYNGLNSAMLVTDATADLENCKISSTGMGAGGFFAVGLPTKSRMHQVSVETSSAGAPGIVVSSGAAISANKFQVTTAGDNSPALLTNGDEATILASDCVLTTAGSNSPLLYSIGTLSVVNSVGRAASSPFIIVEGKNNLNIEQVQFSGGKKWGILMYGALEEDNTVGTSVLGIRNSRLTMETAGPLFRITNTRAAVSLENNIFSFQGPILAEVGAGPWGIPGKNGADFELTVLNQTLNGNISVDKYSGASVNLGIGGVWNGTVNNKGEARSATVDMNKESAWSLSGDAFLDGFKDGDLTLSNVHGNGYHIYYKPKLKANKWLFGKAFKLPNKGMLMPWPQVSK